MIQSAHSDQFGQASVCSLFDFMLEAAWAHAQIMDWGYDNLQRRNEFWVLSRIYMEITQYPRWQDEITLQTWSDGADGMYAYREFSLAAADGRSLLVANSAWLILDLATKRIVRLTDFPRHSGESICRMPQRLRPEAPPEALAYSPVQFSELDINRHFNSVKSLERTLNSFDIPFLCQHEPATVEINYLKEGLAGDAIAISTEYIADTRTRSTLIRQSDGAPVSALQIDWRDRAAQ